MLPFAPMLLSAQLLLVADRPPQLDVRPSCQAVTRAGVNGRTGRTEQICMNEETAAQSTLAESWSQFSAVQRDRCTRLVHTGGPPSYVELLTCLEMAEQARRLPDDGLPKSTSGMKPRED